MISLQGFERILVVEVNIRPVIHYGLKKMEGHIVNNMTQCYEQNRLKESSKEQIMSVPYHEVKFSALKCIRNFQWINVSKWEFDF